MQIVEPSRPPAAERVRPPLLGTRQAAILRNEDWLSSFLGLGLILIAALVFAAGGSIKWLAVAPQKWSHAAQILQQLRQNGVRFAALFAVWALLLGAAAQALGLGAVRFWRAFAPIFVVTAVVYFLGLWDQAAHFNLEPPLVALAIGLLFSNSIGVPRWLDPGLRVELYIKVGIVLLGSSLPLTLLAWAGPVAILQAAIVSLVTFGVIFAAATRLGLDRRLAATLGTGGAVCGVSGAIAIGGAVGAKKQDISVAISLVVVWAIVMIFVLPLAARALGLSTGVAGAWIGTSEFADAAGLAAAQTYGGYAGNVAGISGHPEAAVTAFTLMKVIGRDMWIGVWAFVLSLDGGHALGAYRHREPERRKRDLAAVSEVRHRILARLRCSSPGLRAATPMAEYKSGRAARARRAAPGAANLGFHVCFSEHRIDHARARIRGGRRAAVRRVHAGRGGQRAARLFPVDARIRRFLERTGQ